MATTFAARNNVTVNLTGTTPKIVPVDGPATIHVPAGMTVKVEASIDSDNLRTGATADFVQLDASLVGPAIKKYDLDFAALKLTPTATGKVFIASSLV